MIEIELYGVKELLSDLRDLPESVEHDVILRLSQTAYDSAYRGSGRHFKTGALLQSLYNRQTKGGRAVGHDTNRAPYARHVLFGSRPHKIYPNKKKALRWPKPGGTGFQFAKVVNHPGYKGDDYLKKAKDDALKRLSTIVSDALKEAI